jgi:IS5 family transposase
MCWSGTVVDATLIAAPSSTKNASGERDPEMKQSRKGQQWYFGMKAHIRAKVEHPFRVIKRQFGHVKVRYRGLAKNTAQLHTLFALATLWLAKRRIPGARACVRLDTGQVASMAAGDTRF